MFDAVYAIVTIEPATKFENGHHCGYSPYVTGDIVPSAGTGGVMVLTIDLLLDARGRTVGWIYRTNDAREPLVSGTPDLTARDAAVVGLPPAQSPRASTILPLRHVPKDLHVAFCVTGLPRHAVQR